MSTAPESDIKSRVHETIDSLPTNATWDDVMYRLYVRQWIEAELKNIESGRTLSVSEVRKRVTVHDLNHCVRQCRSVLRTESADWGNRWRSEKV